MLLLLDNFDIYAIDSRSHTALRNQLYTIIRTHCATELLLLWNVDHSADRAISQSRRAGLQRGHPASNGSVHVRCTCSIKSDKVDNLSTGCKYADANLTRAMTGPAESPCAISRILFSTLFSVASSRGVYRGCNRVTLDHCGSL